MAESARAVLDATLAEFGLQELGSWVWQRYLEGFPISQIMLDIRDRPEYQRRFAGMQALSEKGRAISEAEYIQLERTYASLFRSAGIPAGFYDQPEDFARYIANEVSPAEMQNRIEMASTAAYQSPPEVRMELERLWGIGPGELTAYWLDPDKALPMLTQRYSAAQAAGAARSTGYGLLTQNEAQALGERGVTADQAEKGFSTLTSLGELFGALPGQEQSEDEISRQEQMGAVFSNDPRAQQRIERRQSQRKATFSQGGGYASDREGIAGLGNA